MSPEPGHSIDYSTQGQLLSGPWKLMLNTQMGKSFILRREIQRGALLVKMPQVGITYCYY
jgi:hypothetical protein